MSIIRHLVWHDLRALRQPLVAWALVLLAQAAVMATGPRFVDPEVAGGFSAGIADFLAGAKLAFTMLLTVLLIQRDSPVGSTAFWLTRPIRPAAMATSKACSALLVLVILPAIVCWLLFTALGLAQTDVWAGTGNVLVEQVLVTALCAMGAVITTTIPQFGVAAVLGLLLIGTLTNVVRPATWALARIRIPGNDSNVYVWVLVTVIGAIGVTAYQYSRRRVVRAAAGVAAVLVLGVLSVLTVQAAREPASTTPVRPDVIDPDRVTAEVDASAVSAQSGSTRDVQRRGIRYRSASAILRTSGAPPAIILQPWSIESTWQPEGGAPIRWQRENIAYRTTVQRQSDGDDQPNRSIAMGLGGVAVLNPPASSGTAFRTTLVSVPEADVDKMSSAKGPLDAALTLRAWAYKPIEAVLLRVGSSVSARDGLMEVQAISRRTDAFVVDFDRVFLQRMEMTAETALGGAGIGSVERIVLRNRARKEALLATAYSGRQFYHSLLRTMSTRWLGTGTARLVFPFPRADEARVGLDEEWLTGAELVVMRPEDLGIFTKRLRVEWVSLENVR